MTQLPLTVIIGITLTVPSAMAQLEFHGYPCTEDCSGHEAGYEWAADKGIADPDDCGGNSQSFIEGCQAYAEEQQEESADESEPAEEGDY